MVYVQQLKYVVKKTTLDAINQGEAFCFLLKPWNEGELEVATNEGLHRY